MKLQIQNAVKSYGEEKILDGFTIDFPESGIVCLFGPSGCGKTTLLNCIAGIKNLEHGEIIRNREAKISCVFQEDRLLPWLSAQENIAAVYQERKIGLAQACGWLEKMDLQGEEEKKPSQLSGGMCRRVAIARSLAYGGELYLFDEPFQRMDMKTKKNVMELVRSETRKSLAILVTHNSNEMEYMADIACILDGPPLRIVNIIQNRK